MSTHRLFDDSLSCLLPHVHPEWGDRDSLDTFTRLLAKTIRPAGWTANTHLDIKREQVRSRREQWTTDALGRLVRGHSSTAGKDFDCPIIIAEYDGVQYILDGNHRVNRWVSTGDARVHDVNIHTITGSAHYIKLPAVKENV
jgi:hypothetical protein